MNYRSVSLLFVFSLLVRFLFFPYWGNLPLGGDESYYWDLACRIARGELIPQDIFLRPPIWVYLLSISALFADNPLWGRLFTTVLGAAIPPLMYVVGTRIFSKKVGILAGVLSAIYPEFIGYSHYLWSENFYLLFSLVITCLLFKKREVEAFGTNYYLPFAAMGIALLIKETGLLFFVASLSTLKRADILRHRCIPVYAFLLFALPVVIYSAYATYSNKRVILVAEAPFINANEAVYGHKIWKLTREENRELFLKEVLVGKVKHALYTIPKQFANLWTPNSFVIHRLLDAEKFGNYDMPHAPLYANISVYAYLTVVLLGLTGMAVSDASPFKTFSLYYLVFISLSGALFFMCSRFRIPVMHIFCLYTAVLVSEPKKLVTLKTRAKWPSGVVLVISIALVVIVSVTKWKTLGRWG